MSEPEDSEETATEEEVLSYLTTVVHRVAVRIAETIEDPEERARATSAAEEVLLEDEGARDLLAAAFEEGRADVVRGALASGSVPSAPDWSDVESGGERRAIAREEHICGACSHSGVCAIAGAAQQVQALLVIRRCDRFG